MIYILSLLYKLFYLYKHSHFIRDARYWIVNLRSLVRWEYSSFTRSVANIENIFWSFSKINWYLVLYWRDFKSWICCQIALLFQDVVQYMNCKRVCFLYNVFPFFMLIISMVGRHWKIILVCFWKKQIQCSLCIDSGTIRKKYLMQYSQLGPFLRTGLFNGLLGNFLLKSLFFEEKSP